MNRKHKRLMAQLLRGLDTCKDCPKLAECYAETDRIQVARTKYKGTQLLPKELRETPCEKCEKGE